jgi:protease-4
MNWKFWQNKEPMPVPGDENWEKELVNRVVLDSLKDRRSARHWGNLFKLLTFAYLFALLVILWPDDIVDSVTPAEEHTALVEIKGIIAPETQASAENVLKALRKAFEDDKTKGIILRINSPGGSPVQAGQINDEIRRLRKEHEKIPVYAVVEDLCASGGYYIDAFGFEQALDELGIERRLLTAGKNKGILDPFSPLPEQQREYLQGILDKLHQQFIEVVKEGRGDRLQENDEIFSGLFWSGAESVDLGLSDAIGNADYVAREVVGAKKIVEYTAKKDLLERLADRLGASFAESLLNLTGAGAYPVAR